MRTMDRLPAVVGHVEWVEFVRVDHLPTRGKGVDVTPIMQLAAGGGANVAVELAELAGGALLFTSLGNDELGHRALAQLQRRRLDVHVAWRDQATQRTLTLIHPDGERSNLYIGPVLEPSADDPLPGEMLGTPSP